MAVHRHRDVAQVRARARRARAEHLRVLVGHRVADGVGHVDGGGALVDRDLDDLGHELHVGARAVLGRELDVVGVLLGVRHGGARLALHVLARGLELALDVDVARGDEGVDARALGVLDRVPGGVDVLEAGAREPADDRAVHLAGDRLDRLEVAGRGDREARLDHVHAEPRELVGDLHLLLPVERDPGGLLAVAQGGVEDQYSVSGFRFSAGVMSSCFLCLSSWLLRWFAASAAATRYSPRGGRRRRSRRSSWNDIANKPTPSPISPMRAGCRSWPGVLSTSSSASMMLAQKSTKSTAAMRCSTTPTMPDDDGRRARRRGR